MSRRTAVSNPIDHNRGQDFVSASSVGRSESAHIDLPIPVQRAAASPLRWGEVNEAAFAVHRASDHDPTPPSPPAPGWCRRRRGRPSRRSRRRRRTPAASTCRSRSRRCASVTTAPSTQPPDTEPRKLPSSSITRLEPTGRGAEPQVSTTVASATPRPLAPPVLGGLQDVFVARQHDVTPSGSIAQLRTAVRPSRLGLRPSTSG